MISTINLTTGPVAVTPEVTAALAAPPISHRSAAFTVLYRDTCQKLSALMQVKQTYLMTGSGTLANEVMLGQIKSLNTSGLILSNGEFGSRLVRQSAAIGLSYHVIEKSWGEAFHLAEIETVVRQFQLNWILFCHCETSVGVINDLESITDIARRNQCPCFVDCMSTVGTKALNLSAVAMATASSGKALGSVPGLAIVFSNVAAQTSPGIPTYLDLSVYHKAEGVPFTISSNLVNALHVSVSQKQSPHQFTLVKNYAERMFDVLHRSGCLVHSTRDSFVFNIDLALQPRIIENLSRSGIELSHESGYLQQRQWCQLALFGFYTEGQLAYAFSQIAAVIKRLPIQAIAFKGHL